MGEAVGNSQLVGNRMTSTVPPSTDFRSVLLLVEG